MRSSTAVGFIKAMLCAWALCASVPDVLAQWYAGGGLGFSKNHYDSDGLASDLATGGITGTGAVGGSTASGRIFGGYQFGESVALEAGYFNLGDYVNVNGTYTRPAPASTFSGTSKGQGVGLDLVWTVPIARGFSGIARIGGAMFRSDPSWNANAAAFTTMSTAARKNNLIGEGGLGLQYDFNKQVAARLEWLRLGNVGTGLTGGSSSIDNYSMSVMFKF